MATNFTVKIG